MGIALNQFRERLFERRFRIVESLELEEIFEQASPFAFDVPTEKSTRTV